MPQLPRREEERRLAALGIRQQAAEIAAERPHPVDENNGDEPERCRIVSTHI